MEKSVQPMAARGAYCHGKTGATQNQVRSEIKTRLAAAHKWRPVGMQLSLDFEKEGEHLLEKMFQFKRRDLLKEIHKMIFQDQINHYVVFETLIEYLRENSLEEHFPEVQRRDVNMLVACLEEHSNSDNPVQASLLELKSIINQN